MDTLNLTFNSNMGINAFKTLCHNTFNENEVRVVTCGAGIVVLPRQHGDEVNEHELKKALGFAQEYDKLRKEKQQLEKKIAKLDEENAVLRDKYYTIKQEQKEPKKKFVITDPDDGQFFVNLSSDQCRLLDYLNSVLDYNIDYSEFKEPSFVDV